MQIERVIIEGVKPRGAELLRLPSMRALRMQPSLQALHQRITEGLREVDYRAAAGPVPAARSLDRKSVV